MSENGTGSRGSERLLESLWQDARREADQNLARARNQADRLVAGISEHRAQEGFFALERAREKAAPEVARILNRARSNKQKISLETKYRFLDECLAQARETLNRSPEVTRTVRKAFSVLFKQAAALIDREQMVRATVNPADREIAENLIRESGLDCTVMENEDIPGGVRIEASDGSWVVDNTVTSRLRALGEYPPLEILRLTLSRDQDP